jgi:hypothetical protein
MNDMSNLRELATQTIRPDGPVRNGSLQTWAALHVLATTAQLWEASAGCRGCGRCKGGVAGAEEVARKDRKCH